MKDVNCMTQRSDGLKGRSGSPGISGGTWRLLLISVLLAAMLPLGVSAFMFHNDTAHTGVFNDGGTHPNNVLLWNYSFGGFQYSMQVNFTYIMDNSTYASPAVVDGVRLRGKPWRTHLKHLDATTGAVLHTYTVTPLVEGRLMIFMQARR